MTNYSHGRHPLFHQSSTIPEGFCEGCLNSWFKKLEFGFNLLNILQFNIHYLRIGPNIQSNDYELHTKAKSNNEPLIFAFGEVRARLLLCQDLTTSANVRPLRPVRGSREEGGLHHHLQRLLCPRHADGILIKC